MNFEKHTIEMLVVNVTRREKAFTNGLGGGYNFTGEIKTEAVESWGDQFMSAEILGGFTHEWYEANTAHGVRDNKGRELGHEFVISRTRAGWDVRPHATRGGKPYGACQRQISCSTLADAQAIVEEKAAQGKKAAAKAATRGGTKK